MNFERARGPGCLKGHRDDSRSYMKRQTELQLS